MTGIRLLPALLPVLLLGPLPGLSITVAPASAAEAGARATTPGKRIFDRDCAACHSVAPGAGSTEGPGLYGVVGRRIASAPGFDYSAPLRKLAGKSWTAAELDRWLTDSQAYAPDSNMVYFSDNPRERAALIDYLRAAGSGK